MLSEDLPTSPPTVNLNISFANMTNTSATNGTWRLFPGWPPESFLPPSLSQQLLAILMSLYALVVVAAFLANTLVVIVVVRARMLSSFTDTFILSLVVSDLLVAGFTMPVRLLTTVNNEWRLGLAACRLTEYLQGVTIVNNILTLTAIAVNRYLVICQENLHRRVNGRKWTLLILLAVWVVSLLAVIPQLLAMRLDLRIRRDDKGEIVGLAWVCVEEFTDRQRQTYTIGIYVCLYLLPMCLMAFAYGAITRRLWVRRFAMAQALINPRLNFNLPQQQSPGLVRRRRVTVMLVTLVVTFTLLWLPFFSASLYMEFHPGGAYESGFRKARAFLQLVGYSTCVVNPVIYTFLNRKFQDHLYALCCRPTRNNSSRVDVVQDIQQQHQQRPEEIGVQQLPRDVIQVNPCSPTAPATQMSGGRDGARWADTSNSSKKLDERCGENLQDDTNVQSASSEDEQKGKTPSESLSTEDRGYKSESQ